MKKKSLLIAGLTFVSACSLAFAFGCKDKNGGNNNVNDPFATPADDWVLQSIELDLSNIKLEYDYNQAFDASQKPAVTATYATLESVINNEENKLYESSSNRLVTEKRAVAADDIIIDYSQYDPTAVGTYSIFVSYTYAGVSRAASYQVEVKSNVPGFGGITAVTVDGFVTEYVISGQDGVNIDLTGLAFHTVGSDLEVSETAIASTDYTLEYYLNGTEKIESLSGITEKGTYTIMATYETSGVKAKAFVAISVLNPITGFEIKEGYKSEQVQSPVDELTSTWVFNVTYSSGKTVELKKGDAGLIIGNPVTVTAAERTSKVTYTEDNETKSLDIPYTITKDDKLVNEENAYDKAAFGITSGGDVKLTQANLKGANAFLTKGEASNVTLNYRPGTDDGVLEFRNDALQIEFKGFGSLTVSVRSTSNSNNSGVGLKDAKGNFITALYDATDAGITEGTYDDKGNVYAVTGSLSKPVDARYLTFIIPEAGVYTLCTVGKVTVGDTDIDTGRNARLYVLEQVDVFDSSIDRVSYALSINTDNVKKDYIAGQTAESISLEGLTAEFIEQHSAPDVEDVKTPINASDLKFALTAGDMSKLNTTGTVTVTYTKDGKDYTATYEINVKSPVTGVNSVVLSKETLTYNLESATAETVTVNTDDVVLHANGADGTAITLGEGDSVTYKLLDKDGNELPNLGAKLGKNTLVATVVLKNTEAAVEGTTTFEAQIEIEVEAWVDPDSGVQTKNIVYTPDADPAADSIVKANKNDKVVTVTANKLYAVTGNNATKFGTESAFHLQKSNGSIVTVVINGSIAGSASITIEFFHTNGSTQRELAIYKDSYSEDATPIATSEKVTNAQLNTFVLNDLSDGTYVITGGNDNTDKATTVYAKSITVKYSYESKGDEVDYTFDINTDEVKKDYVAGETELSKAGLEATLVENHSVDTGKNKTHKLTADDLTIEVTSGDLSKLNTTAIVTVSYIYEGTTYTKNYIINVKSPVEGVNGVALTKETTKYTLASETAETVEISNADIVIHANTASGKVITLGEGESVTYKLYKGEEEQESWTVGVGSYVIKAIVILNNTEAAVAGTTTFTAEIAVNVGEYVAPGGVVERTVHYAVDTSAADGIYTLASTDDTDGVAVLTWVNGSATEKNDTAKEIGGVTYSNCINVNGGSRYITLTLTKAVKSLTIACGSSNADRTVGLFSGEVKNTANSSADNALGSLAITSGGGTGTFTVENLAAGTYTITAVTTGSTSTVRVYGVIIDYEETVSSSTGEAKTVNYTVDTSATDGIYTLASTDDTDNVATLTWVNGSATEKNDTAKEIGGVTYSNCINVNGGGRYITLALTKNVKSITIVCGSANAGRTVGLFSGTVSSASNSSADNALGSLAINENGATGTFTVENLTAGTYTITAVTTGSTATVRVYGVIIEYEA